MVAMQIRGRHRGLPYALDRAILLPSESLHQRENEDATRRARRGSAAAAAAAMDVGGMQGITRQGTGLSRRSSFSVGGSAGGGDAMSGGGAGGAFAAPARIKKVIGAAFRAGPGVREKNA